MIICSTCKVPKEDKDYSKDFITKTGYRVRCKSCDSLIRKQKRLDKGSKIHVNRKEDKKGFKTCSNCQIEKSHNDFTKSTVTKDKLTSKCKECTRKYSLNNYKNPARRAVIFCNIYKKIDLKKAIVNDLTSDFLLNCIITKPCTYCNQTDENIGCDRVDNSKGHFQSNVVPCCNTCNSVRSNKFTIEEMLELGKIIKNIKQNRLKNG